MIKGWRGPALLVLLVIIVIVVVHIATNGQSKHQTAQNSTASQTKQDKQTQNNQSSNQANTTGNGNKETASAPADGKKADAPKPILVNDFENNNMGLWNPHSGGKLSVSSSVKHSGKYSLEITGRKQTFEGPALDISPLLDSNKTYHVSVWVMYNSGPATHGFTLSDELDKVGGSQSYGNIANAMLTKGKWTLLQGDITVPNTSTIQAYKVYVETAYKKSGATSDDLVPFYIDDFALANPAPLHIQGEVPSLKKELAPYFPIGTAIEPNMLNASDPNNALIIKHYKSLTAGNFMKVDAMEPTEGNFNWSTADKLVQFAQKHNMLIRGHNLLWHNQMPSWYFVDPNDSTKLASRDLLLKRLKTYISTVVGHYKGKIQYWDVVNEVISDKTAGLRGEDEGSHWPHIVGDVNGNGTKDDFIRLAFEWAHQADPKAKLVINDYNLVTSQTKQDTMYKVVKHLLAEGTPIHAIGMQMHISMYGPDADAVKAAIERFASLGVKVEVTELDMSIYHWGDKKTIQPTQDILMQQAVQYKALFDVFKEEAKKGNLESVTLWGSADNDTWLDNFPVKGRLDAPLLFNRKLQAKPAFWAIVDPSKIGLSN